jgi:hypothetical protein
MSDMEIRATKIGPFVSGTIREKQPRTAAERRTRLICWILTCLVLASASPMLGVILILTTAMYLAATTAPDSSTPDERNHR